MGTQQAGSEHRMYRPGWVWRMDLAHAAVGTRVGRVVTEQHGLVTCDSVPCGKARGYPVGRDL